MYHHRIGESSGYPETARSRAERFLARSIRSKTLALRGAPPMVTFTFDDVPDTAGTTGAPILESYGIRGTFYVAGRGCGTAGCGGPRLASIEQLRAIWRRGHEIGCHTHSHPAVSRIGLGVLGAELEQNRRVLADIDRNIEVKNFAYPYGAMSLSSKRYLQARFASCRGVHPGINRGTIDLGALKAWPLTDEATDRAKIAALLAATRETSGWLIFYTHEVAERPSRYGVSPDLLAFAVAAASRSGCAIGTVAESLDRIAACSKNQGARAATCAAGAALDRR